MSEELLYYNIPDPPATISGATIIIRMIDGLGFRFRWATEGLRETDYDFRPKPDVMSIRELIEHIWGLCNWIKLSITTNNETRPHNILLIRKSILDILWSLRKILISMDEDDFKKIKINKQSFWHIINGPISDALTHVGQINSFRRIAGNPIPNVNVFLGIPLQT